MAKISPASIKYMISASFTAAGPLEKPDVIGAIFGQTEGLLGAELEMRELQKEGKIGRIEVTIDLVDGKSVGEIQIPSALDKSETTLVAAALETIDKVGPTEAKIEVRKIEDVRGAKRDFIIDRAKKLLEGLDAGSGDFEEQTKTLAQETRAAKIQEYGEEKLPAGDLSGREVIVVEGRADVVNLLKNRVNNVIGMNGTKLPAEIARLGSEKELTLFVDGDRGGKLIAGNVIANARVEFVAVAPDGKEVEELTGKEILMALRKRVPTRVYMNKEGREVRETRVEVPENNMPQEEVAKNMREKFKLIAGTKDALLLDAGFDVIKQISGRDVQRALIGIRRDIFAVVIDGQASSGVIRACDERGVKSLGATTFSAVEASNVKLVSL